MANFLEFDLLGDYFKRLDLLGGLKEIADFIWQSLYLMGLSLVRPVRALDMLSAKKSLAWGMLATLFLLMYWVHRFYYHQVGFEFLANMVLSQRFGDLAFVSEEVLVPARARFQAIYLNTAYVPPVAWFVFLLLLASVLRPFTGLRKSFDKPYGYGQYFLLSVITLMPLVLCYLWLLVRLLLLQEPDQLMHIYPLTLAPYIFPILETTDSYWLVVLAIAVAPLNLFNLWSLALMGMLFRRLFRFHWWAVVLTVALFTPVVASFNFLVQQ